MLLTKDVEEFGALQKPREAKEHRDRFAHKHGVVVVRPACGERDTYGNSGPDYDGGATMDLRHLLRQRTFLPAWAAAEPNRRSSGSPTVVLTTPMIAA